MSHFKLVSHTSVIELGAKKQKAPVYIWPIVKIEGLLAPEISKFTKLYKFQKSLAQEVRQKSYYFET